MQHIVNTDNFHLMVPVLIEIGEDATSSRFMLFCS